MKQLKTADDVISRMGNGSSLKAWCDGSGRAWLDETELPPGLFEQMRSAGLLQSIVKGSLSSNSIDTLVLARQTNLGEAR